MSAGMKNNDDGIHTSIYLPKKMLVELKAIAVATEARHSVSNLINRLLAQFLQQQSKNTVATIDTESKQAYDFELSGYPEMPEEFRRWILKLIYILETNNGQAVTTVKNVLTAMTQLSDLAGGRHAGISDQAALSAAHEAAAAVINRRSENAKRSFADLERGRTGAKTKTVRSNRRSA